MPVSRTIAGLLIAGLVTTATVSTVATAPAWSAPVSAAAAPASTLADPTELATDEDKVEAARVLGINPGIDMLVLNDQEFVLSLWRQARAGSFVKAEALRAFDTTDSNAAYAFIKTGVFAAAADDAQAEIVAEHAKALRRSVAVTVQLDPADTELIERSDRDFIFAVWQRVEAGSHVWTAAQAAIAEGTDQEDWTAFLTTGAQVAREQDIEEEIIDKNEEQIAKLRALQLATAKRALLQLLLLPVSEEIVSAPNRQYVLHVHNNAKGTEVKLASQIALNSPDAELDKALSDFIFTGGAAANKKDEDAAAAKELAGYRTTTTAIRDAAKEDGYQPNLVVAADKALTDNTLIALQTFLLKGQEDARKLDEAFRAKASRDFSGDQKPDVLTVATTGELFLYRGKGTGTFEGGRTTMSTAWGTWDLSFSPGDFNGDGFADVITRRGGELHLHRGDGKGGFLEGGKTVLIGTSGWAKWTAIFSPGDFNGDGFSDVIVRDPADQLRLYRGNGKGGWLDPTSNLLIGSSGWNKWTAIFSPGDFNGDTFSDVIVRDPSGQLRLYRGNGKGGWLDPTTNLVIGSSGWNKWTGIFSSGDFTGDGRADVIVRDPNGELRLYRGNGKGGWIDPSSNIVISTAGFKAFKAVF
jgi:hypothetical protein